MTESSLRAAAGLAQGARRSGRGLAGLLLASALAGCASLPSSGPTAHDIEQDQKTANALGFRIVDIDPGVVAHATPAGGGPGQGLAALAAPGRVDTIGPGDLLQITVFEVGTTLFAPTSGSAATASAGAPPSAAGANFPVVTVGRDGTVTLPYIGRIGVAGHTVDEVQAMIAEGLQGKSQTPQVIVSIRENVANTAVVMGDVKKPGRLPLTLAGDRVLDAIASAGGATYAIQDSVVTFRRGQQSAQMRLDRIAPGSDDDLALLPQDRIEVLYRPRSFTIFGATKVAETQFQTPRLSLAEAVGRAGGPTDQQADPTAVYVFRYEPADLDGAPLPGATPVAYRLDLMRPQSYFLAQAFEMHPRDVIYIANARSNQPVKLIQILNLFFQPFYTAKVVAQ